MKQIKLIGIGIVCCILFYSCASTNISIKTSECGKSSISDNTIGEIGARAGTPVQLDDGSYIVR